MPHTGQSYSSAQGQYIYASHGTVFNTWPEKYSTAQKQCDLVQYSYYMNSSKSYLYSTTEQLRDNAICTELQYKVQFRGNAILYSFTCTAQLVISYSTVLQTAQGKIDEDNILKACVKS